MAVRTERQRRAQSPRSGRRHRRFQVLSFLLLSGLCLVLSWYGVRHLWLAVPLPADEEMIAHLNAHRAEFEELVRRHRTFIEREHWPELKWPSQEEGTDELRRQVKVGNINHLSLLYWLPQPYTQATARRVKAIDDQCSEEIKQWHAIDGKKNNIPPPKCRLNSYQYGVLYFDPSPCNKFWRRSLRYFNVWKTYLHFPEPPKIEDGFLLGPMETDGTYSYRKRVFPSLNCYPPAWREYECVYRRIDAHWFIRLCNGH